MKGDMVVIVGAGIVGLAIAYHLCCEGVAVTVVDRDPEGDKASFGNAGAIAVTDVIPASVPGVIWKVPGWLLNPLGPLAVRPMHVARLTPWLWRFARAGRPQEVMRITAALSALNARTYDDLMPMLATIGFTKELNRLGALTVYETEHAFRKSANEWATKRAYGITAECLTETELHTMEPALGPVAKFGVFTPQWSHVNDPKLLVEALRHWLQAEGVKILAGTVHNIDGKHSPTIELEDNRTLTARSVVIAAGAWSSLLAKHLGDRVLLESERGYNTTIPRSGVHLKSEIIFAERNFVATPLSCGLRIGGAAEFGGLNAPANFKRSQALVKLASRYLPTLQTEEGISWAGHRPATPDSLPVISGSARYPNVFYAFGHGHLGLTQAATTGRLVADLVQRRPPPIDLAPYAVSRFS